MCNIYFILIDPCQGESLESFQVSHWMEFLAAMSPQMAGLVPSDSGPGPEDGREERHLLLLW